MTSACRFASLFGLALLSACEHKAPSASRPSAPAAKSALPVDRLAPGELPPGESAVFGLVVPRGMRVTGRMKDSAVAVGNLNAEAVANYVRLRVDVEHVEIGAARTIFPDARIKQGPSDRSFRIEVMSDGPITRLSVEDITPAPLPPKEDGLSDAERWRRAGFSPDGKPLNMKALE